ncbi:MAG: protein kinase [Bdellovibrionales bacterium]|nr:protein kinase [Bdellovibrionales bacterium]
MIEEAKKLSKNGQFLEAAKIYSSLDFQEKAQEMLGMHALQKRDFSTALTHLRQTKRFDLLAKVYQELGLETQYFEAKGQEELQKGELESAAQSFLRGKLYLKAAKAFDQLSDDRNAAINYLKAGEVEKACNHLRKIGDHLRVARIYEMYQQPQKALQVYRNLGVHKKVEDILQEQNRIFELTKHYFERGDSDKAILLIDSIQYNHPDFARTQFLLARHEKKQGEYKRVLSIFHRCFEDHRISISPSTLFAFGVLLEEIEAYTEALKVFYSLIEKDDQSPELKNKIDQLENKISPVPTSEIKNIKNYENRFQVLQTLGKGAMGVVYKANDILLNKIVAVKTMYKNHLDDQELLKAFIQEGETAKKLDHPNIIQVYDYGMDGSQYFISMEYLNGKTLDLALKKLQRMSLENLLSIAIPLCSAIDYAHEHDIIHRDIKPSNVMLLPSKGVKLMDFGISKIVNKTFSYRSLARGTPIYMSPEQILGIQTNKQSDLYSLGILLFEMACGEPPFKKGDVLYDHIHKSPPELAKLDPSVPMELVNVIMPCLAKKPEGRPQSVKKIMDVLVSLQHQLDLVHRELETDS